MSKDGVRIDPERVVSIQELEAPRNKKEVQSFLGRIKFLRIFIPNLAEQIKTITNMLKTGKEVK